MTDIEHKRFDQLHVQIHPTRQSAGRQAGKQVAEELKKVIAQKDKARIVFAAAPSQNEMLETLVQETDIPWNRVTAFHMDEYIGLAKDAPQRFANYLKIHLFDKISFGNVFFIENEDPTQTCEQYAQRLNSAPIDLVCMGIGENGHIAFNDPPVADFNDPETVKIVQLDEACRRQQVHDGCFPDLDSVPKTAVTLTIPALIGAKCLICVVPGTRKGPAVGRMLNGKISTECPASILRTHPNCVLYVDHDCWVARNP